MGLGSWAISAGSQEMAELSRLTRPISWQHQEFAVTPLAASSVPANSIKPVAVS